MERAEWEALAGNMRELARENPAAYRRKVAQWVRIGIVGYWAIFVLCNLVGLMAIILILGSPLGAIGVVVGVILIFSAFRMLRRVREEQPKLDLVLPPERAPELRRVVDEVARKLNAPPIKTLALSGSHNATAYILRRPFRRPTYCVELGLPLLITRSPSEAKGIIAHELAHHIAADGDVSRKVSRLYDRWFRLAEPTRSQIMDGIVKAFGEWYFPRFSAITGAYRLQAEFDADRVSTQVVPADDAALAMIRYSVLEDHLFHPLWERYLDEIIAGTGKPSSFQTYLAAHAADFVQGDASNTMRVSLTRTTTFDDSHPALSDRLAQLGVSFGSSPDYAALALKAQQISRPSAAEALLGQDLAWAAAYLDEVRANRHRDSEQEAIELRKTTLALSENREVSTFEERVEHARALSQMGRFDESRALVEELLLEEPNDLTLQMARGGLLLSLADEAGIDYLHDLARERPILSHEIEYRIASYFEEQGRSHEAREARIRGDELAEAYAARHAALTNLSDGLNWFPASITAELTETVQEYCRSLKIVRAAYVVERRDPEWADLVIDVCLLVLDPPGFSVSNESGLESQIAKIRRLNVPAPMECWAVLPMMVAAKHAAQYVPPVYVRGQ